MTSLRVLGWMSSDSEIDTPVIRFSFFCPFYACMQLDTLLVFYMFGTDITHLYVVGPNSYLKFYQWRLIFSLYTTFVKIKLPVKYTD